MSETDSVKQSVIINNHFELRLLFRHLFSRCSNVEVLGDIVEPIILIAHTAGQYHGVLSNLSNACAEYSTENIKN